MKNLLCLLVAIIIIESLALLTCIASSKGRNKMDLEIYTTEDIYYVDGLQISTESNDLIYQFDDKKELKEFISYVTANSIKK